MDDLTTLLREAVEDVEPTDRRAELRELVAVSSGRRHRRYAIAGGLLAAAVVGQRPSRRAPSAAWIAARTSVRRTRSTTSARPRRDRGCSVSSGAVRGR